MDRKALKERVKADFNDELDCNKKRKEAISKMNISDRKLAKQAYRQEKRIIKRANKNVYRSLDKSNKKIVRKYNSYYKKMKYKYIILSFKTGIIILLGYILYNIDYTFDCVFPTIVKMVNSIL